MRLRGVFLAAGLLVSAGAAAQSFDPAWYRDVPAVKIAVARDGVYRVTGAELAAAGFPLGASDRLELLRDGRAVPFLLLGPGGATLAPTDTVVFVGERNRGTHERWAYDRPESQSSAYFSLYTDTTFYWLRAGDAAGRRYAALAPLPAPPAALSALVDTVHVETDAVRYDGDSNDSGHPLYTRGEAFYMNQYIRIGPQTTDGAQDFTYAIPLGRYAPAPGDSVRLKVRLSSGSASRHRASLHVGADTTTLALRDWFAYGFRDLERAVPAGAVSGATLPVRVRVVNRAGTVDFTTAAATSAPNSVFVDYAEAAFRRALRAEAGQDRFVVPAGPQHLRLSGYGGARVVALAPGAGRAAVLPATAGEAALTGSFDAATPVWTADPAALLRPARLARAGGPAIPRDVDYVVVTTPLLRPSAEALAAYRRAKDGFRVAVVEQAQLFDQFDYGRPTPLALRRYVHAAVAGPTPPRFVTLWGDALLAERNRAVQPWEVIAFGNAVSDGWIAMNTKGEGDWTEALAVGRLPMRTNATGQAFVDKLTAYERSAPGPWQRRSTHVSGGLTKTVPPNPNDLAEVNTLASYQAQWADVLEAPPAAFDARLYVKRQPTLNTSTVLQDSLQAAFERGTSWLAYFSHSSAQIWEVQTRPPTQWNNAARLPLVLTFGCRTGSFSLGTATSDVLSFAEELVLASPNGGIAHWGSSELSQISPSGVLGTNVHRLAAFDTVRVLGPLVNGAKQRYAAAGGAFDAKTLLQFGLIGDPATHLQLPTGPDFHLSVRDVAFGRDAPVVADGEIDVTATVHNYGLLPTDSVTVALTHTRPDGSSTTYRRRLGPLADSVTVAFALPLGPNDTGEHRVALAADADGAFAEADEADNRAERRVTVFARGLAIAGPHPYAPTSRTPTLRVVPTTSLAAPVPVLFELDTLRTFTSPWKRQHRTEALVAADYAPGTLDAGRTYFWRTRLDEAGQEDVWVTGVFTVDETAPAGAVATGPLLTDGPLDRIERAGGTWRFADAPVGIRLVSERSGPTGGTQNGVINVGTQSFLSTTLGWGVVVLDGVSGEVRAAHSLPTYDIPASLKVRFPVFGDRARAVLDSLSRSVRPGDVVLTRTRLIANTEGLVALQPDVRASLKRLGSAAADTLTYGHLWWMVARAGDPSSVREGVVAPSPQSEVIKDSTLNFLGGLGLVTSARFGPAARWTSARADVRLDGPDADAVFAVLGTDGAVLLDNLPANTSADLSGIDARVHPTLRLRATLLDASRRATPQLDRFAVAYDPIPEVALDPAAFSLSADTLAEAAPLTVRTAVVHLGQATAATVVVRYVVTDAGNRERVLGADTVRALAPGARVALARTLPTDGLAGLNRLRIVAEQPGLAEPVTSNNVLLRTFRVAADRVPPTFAVRIDGEAYPNDPAPISNLQDLRYPFVSARPTIEVAVTDANAFRPLTDSTVAVLTLDGRRISLRDPRVAFTPATAERPEARVVFSPDLSRNDSTHTLRLQVFDASGNEATGSPYQVHFRVVQTLAAERALPYPNPMTTGTTFAFRLRGADASGVEEASLRVYTVAGRLVRAFDLVADPGLLDGGGLRIGWNKLRWDGTDADGDRLAPGVYLYRFVVKADGGTLDIRDGRDEPVGVERLVIVR